jgi:hypothetical protein
MAVSPVADGTEPHGEVAAGADTDQAADAVAAVAAVLRERLAHAAALAETPGDRAACHDAAAAAARICQLMTRGNHGTDPGEFLARA